MPLNLVQPDDGDNAGIGVGLNDGGSPPGLDVHGVERAVGVEGENVAVKPGAKLQQTGG